VSRKLTALASAVALIAGFCTPGSAQARARHDFDQRTLAAYISLRFSSAVPTNVIRRVLAAEGFSRRDRRLIAARGAPQPEASGSRDFAPITSAGVGFSQEISRDRLPCPSSDHTPCELDTQPELHIAVNPTSRDNLVGVFQQGRFPNGGSVDPGWAASFDGGRTWPVKGSAPGLTVAVSGGSTAGPGAPFARASDPVVAFDRKHNVVLFNNIGVSDPGCAIFCDSALTVNRSTNGGRTFGGPIIVHEDVADPNRPVFNDKNWIATDNNPGSPFYGRTYVVWDQVRCGEPTCSQAVSQPVVLRYSDDGGLTWSPLIQATAEQPSPVHSEIGVQPVPLPNGHLVILYGDVQAGAFTFLGSYKSVRSTNGGQSWSSPVLVDNAAPFVEETANLRAPNLPLVASDHGTIYVVYQDARFGAGRNDILLKKSTNEGQSWSPAVNVTPGELALDHFTPAIAAVGGKLHLTYYTRAAGNLNLSPLVGSVYRRLDSSGGTTFGPVQLAAPSNATVAAFTTVAGIPLKFFGDYIGIAASTLAAHPLWAQAQNFPNQHPNPTNTHERAFSARVE
jgi:BNR repeat protein